MLHAALPQQQVQRTVVEASHVLLMHCQRLVLMLLVLVLYRHRLVLVLLAAPPRVVLVLIAAEISPKVAELPTNGAVGEPSAVGPS